MCSTSTNTTSDSTCTSKCTSHATTEPTKATSTSRMNMASVTGSEATSACQQQDLHRRVSETGIDAETETEREQQPLILGDITEVLQAVDRFEDQVDDIAYKELVPQHIKLALEDNVFRWSNMFSSILGHVGITLAAYYLTYFAFGYSIIAWMQIHNNHNQYHSVCWTTKALQVLISLWAAVGAYRMVRRRQHVWFRSAYGSKAYLQDYLRRRTEVAEIDSTTLLGRIRSRRNVYLRGRCLKTLSQAETRFDSWTRKKARRRRPSFQTFSVHETKSIENDQVLFASGPIRNMPYSHGCFFGAAPFLVANPDWISILRHLMPDVYVELSRRVHHHACEAPKLIHWAENNPVVAAFGTANELANTGRVVNLEWDVFLEPRLVRRIELVLDQRDAFRLELKAATTTTTTTTTTCQSNRCDFDSDADVNSSCSSSSSSSNSNDKPKGCGNSNNTSNNNDDDHMMLWTLEQRRIMEYLDQELERRSAQLVDRMLIAHGKLTQLLMEQTGRAKDYNYSRVARTRRTLGGGMYARQWMAVYAEALRLGMQMADSFETTTNAQEDGVYSDDGMESSEREWNGRMRRTESCPLLYDCDDDGDAAGDKVADLYRHGKSHKVPTLAHSVSTLGEGSSGATCLSSLGSSNCPNSSIAESVALLRRITKKIHPIGLVLDMKSRHVPKRVWAIVVNYLNAAGARVEAIASFTIDEIRDISHLCRKPMVEIIFCHSAGEMQKACHEGKLRYGDTVFMNGGSLMWEAPVITGAYLTTLFCGEFDPASAMSQYNLLPFTSTRSDADNTLKAYKERLNLKLGLYVQEFGIDDAALDVLVRFVNSNPTLVEHGLSWGGINGIAVRGIRPSRWNPTDGFSTQRYVSIPWDSTKSAQDVLVSSVEQGAVSGEAPKSDETTVLLS